MKAIVFHNYGSPDVLKCEEIEKSIQVSEEVLIKVCGFLSFKLGERFQL